MNETTQTSDQTERNKAAVLRFMELADARDFNAFDEVLTPDFLMHLGETTLTREELNSLASGVYEAFPDFTHTVEEILAVGDRVVMRATDRGTHRGPFEGIAPTGRSVVFGQIAIYRMVEGRIAEIWEQVDFQGFMQQLQAPDSADQAEAAAGN